MDDFLFQSHTVKTAYSTAILGGPRIYFQNSNHHLTCKQHGCSRGRPCMETQWEDSKWLSWASQMALLGTITKMKSWPAPALQSFISRLESVIYADPHMPWSICCSLKTECQGESKIHLMVFFRWNMFKKWQSGSRKCGMLILWEVCLL